MPLLVHFELCSARQCVYIYIEREREREREGYIYIYIYIYIHIHVYTHTSAPLSLCGGRTARRFNKNKHVSLNSIILASTTTYMISFFRFHSIRFHSLGFILYTLDFFRFHYIIFHSIYNH